MLKTVPLCGCELSPHVKSEQFSWFNDFARYADRAEALHRPLGSHLLCALLKLTSRDSYQFAEKRLGLLSKIALDAIAISSR